MGHSLDTAIEQSARVRGMVAVVSLGVALLQSACLPGLPEDQDGFLKTPPAKDKAATGSKPSGTTTNASKGDAQALRSEAGRCAELALDVEAILTDYCAGCHAGSKHEGGFNSILDVEALVESDKVVPGDPDGSLLYGLVERGVMPRSSHKPGREEIAMLRDWISCGAVAFDAARE